MSALLTAVFQGGIIAATAVLAAVVIRDLLRDH